MIAVDTNVLLDVILRGAEHADVSRAALYRARKAGALFVCEIVYAEIAAQFAGDAKATDKFLREAGIELDLSTREILALAGASWREYRQRGGKRDRMAADFLIGAHAVHRVGVLLTRDEGFYKTNFKKLRVVNPLTTRGKT
ncbi:MAG: PIN domain-containing protein [Deltaproteobacteria bacterium]|nr:PIN domain-containing protein [Deltaproteobacteria bacterium]